jgi:hypothetical protein
VRAVAIGVAQLVAGIVNPQASPILVVGQSAIDATPEWLKAFAIRAFGERDKTVLRAHQQPLYVRSRRVGPPWG